MFMQKLRKDKRGFSLIELVCAIAILSIITTTIGGAMVFASNSYRQGSVDTALQQEAQFTVNSIESLIIDATDTVTYSGGTLTIKNVDYTYEIVYDATNRTLRYTQYTTGDPGDIVADNQLLAENVKNFKVDASQFETARNVGIEISLENGDSTFTSDYNITSRNDASAGDAPEIVAEIQCEDVVVLEPLQEYFLDVSVVGNSNTGFSARLEGNESGATEAKLVPGGVMIKLAVNETGGDDGQFRMLISTSVLDASGNPFTKWVTIQVRRVNTIGLSTVSVEGPAYKAGTIYRCTATAQGTNLEERPGAKFDMGNHSYINPDTIRWSFEVADGSDWNEWLEVVGGVDDKEIAVKLKKDVNEGDCIIVTATGMHAKGILRGGTQWTNKAARAASAETAYGNPHEPFKIEKPLGTGNADFLRGDDFDIQIMRDFEALIREDWENNPGNDGKEFDPNKDGYNSGYTGNHHIRYISLDDENEKSKAKNPPHDGYSYPGWKKLSYQGMDPKKIEFKASDLEDMKYMQRYKLELVYSFKYNNKDNKQCVFPYDFDPSKENQRYVHTWYIDPIEVTFDKVQAGWNGPVIDLASNGYLNDRSSGIGTLTNPLRVPKSEISIDYSGVGPGSNWKAGVANLLSSNAALWKWNGTTWEYKGTLQVRNNFKNDAKRQTGTITLVSNNLESGVTYKVVLGKTVSQAGKSDFQQGLIYTDRTGNEQYSLDNTEGKAGRGLIYFKFD